MENLTLLLRFCFILYCMGRVYVLNIQKANHKEREEKKDYYLFYLRKYFFINFFCYCCSSSVIAQ